MKTKGSKPRKGKWGRGKSGNMFEFEVNDSVILKQQEVLEMALSTNPKMAQELRKIIRAYVLEARKEVVEGITFKHGDPRGARQAVKTSVYKRVLGANINILSGRGSHGTNSYVRPRTLRPGQRGGNRKKRTTLDRGKYAPLDRGFILRWLNAGTPGNRSLRNFKVVEARERVHRGSQGGNVKKYGKTVNTGFRGNIAARNFFRPLGDRALGIMRDNLEKAIVAEIEEVMGKMNK